MKLTEIPRQTTDKLQVKEEDYSKRSSSNGKKAAGCYGLAALFAVTGVGIPIALIIGGIGAGFQAQRFRQKKKLKAVKTELYTRKY